MFIQAWLWEHYMNSERSQALYERILSVSRQGSQEYMVAQAKLAEYRETERIKQEAELAALAEMQKDRERFKKLQISNGQWSEYKPEDYTSYGMRYLDEKKIDLAIIHLQGAVKIDPNNPEAHYLHAMAQLESAFIGNENGYVIAKRELEACLALDPDAALRQKATDLLNSLTKEEEPAE
jgi:tetratricopeptide (TPR) repeat protein